MSMTMMFKKKLISFSYLITIFSKVACGNNFLASRRNGDNLKYCVTDSDYAIAWIGEEDTNINQISTFVPNPNIEHLSLLGSNNWSLKKSLEWNINEVILDRRWEGIETATLKFEDQSHNNVEIWSNLSHNFDIPFSIKGLPTVNIYFCDGPSSKLTNCYVVTLDSYGRDYVFEFWKCSTHSSIRRSNLNCHHKLDSTISSSISYISWSHFKISKAGDELSLFNFDGENYHMLLHAIDKLNTINVTRMKILNEYFFKDHPNSYFKIHTVECFYTDQESNNLYLTNYLMNTSNSEICISFFVLMCDVCQLKLTLTQDKEIFFAKVYEPKITASGHSVWYHVKFLVENLAEGNYTVLISTIGNNSKQFWAVDEIRECQKREFRAISSETEKTCQLMNGLNNVISIANITLKKSEDQCDRASFGGICVPHWWLYKGWDSGITFCSTYDEKGSICSCVRGFTLRSECKTKCGVGFYGYNCENKCKCFGSIKAECHYITGMCYRCPSNYTGIECNKRIPPIQNISTYSKYVNSIYLRWKPAIQIFDEIYSFTPTVNIIDYYFKDDNKNTLRIKKSEENRYRCQLWSEFLCLTLINLKNNTEYTIKIQVEYFHNVDVERTDVSPVSTIKTRTSGPWEAPYDLKMIWNEENFLNLEWKHPNQSNGNISYFMIQISIPTLNANYTRRIKVDSYNLTYYCEIGCIIPPATTYFIELSAYNGFEGKKLTQSDTSPPDVPSLVGEPQATTSSDLTAITILPKRPRQSLNTLCQLFVYISNDNFTKEEEDEFRLKKALLVIRRNLTQFDQNITLFTGNFSQPQFQKCYQKMNNLVPNSKRTYNIRIVLKNSFRNRHRIKIYSLICFTEKSLTKNIYLIFGILIILFILLVAITAIVCKKRKWNTKTLKNTENSKSRYSQKNKTTARKKLKEDAEEMKDLKDICSKPVSVKDFDTYVTKCEKTKEFERQHEMVAATFLEDIYNEITGEYFDYINMISTKSEPILKAYIVMELLPQTSSQHFWKIVWDNEVQHIVLQKHIDEETCKQYWPEKSDKMYCDGISVQLAFTKAFQNYHYRKFILIQEDEIRQVDQVHLTYAGIDPDKYVPFFKRILKFPLNSESPILMHSSHGLDRVGMILLCDMSLKMAEREHVIDVWKILNILSKYKIQLAGNSLQYRFAHSIILKCLLEENCREVQENIYLNY